LSFRNSRARSWHLRGKKKTAQERFLRGFALSID